MRKIHTFVAVTLALIPCFSLAKPVEPEDLMPSLVRPTGTVYCSSSTTGRNRNVIRRVSDSDPINLRAGPGTRYPVVDTIFGGSGNIVARYQNWFEVSGYMDSPYTNGWFHGKYLNVSALSLSDRACLRIPRNFNPR